MTKKENIATLNEHLEHWKRLLSEKICDQDEGEKTIDALQNAIKALEQELCEDAISRSAALEAFGLSEKSRKYGGDHSGYDTLMKYEIQDILEDLPPVTPQQKVGRWIEHFDESGKWYECDQCHTDWGGTVNYCPNCGADMRGDVNVNDK